MGQLMKQRNGHHLCYQTALEWTNNESPCFMWIDIGTCDFSRCNTEAMKQRKMRAPIAFKDATENDPCFGSMQNLGHTGSIGKSTVGIPMK